jgi:hypothetical protein
MPHHLRSGVEQACDKTRIHCQASSLTVNPNAEDWKSDKAQEVCPCWEASFLTNFCLQHSQTLALRTPLEILQVLFRCQFICKGIVSFWKTEPVRCAVSGRKSNPAVSHLPFHTQNLEKLWNAGKMAQKFCLSTNFFLSQCSLFASFYCLLGGQGTQKSVFSFLLRWSLQRKIVIVSRAWREGDE